jgi:tRNA threonylcarbamoyladenosine biosynthesis protein TsaB
MALILSLETSTSVSSVALFKDSEMIFSNVNIKEKSHSGSLLKLIQNSVEISGYSLKGLEGVAVSKGPGSYTGLRIATSVAKGLCFALDIPLIAINTLESMAWGINIYNTEKMLLCPMIDARRMEVYCMVLDHQLKVIEGTMAKIIEENSFDELLEDNQIIFFGDGAEKTIKYIGSHSNSRFIENFYPQAAYIGVLAGKKFSSKDFEDLAYFEPYYLKEFISFKSLKN